jgi:hypothetical protein
MKFLENLKTGDVIYTSCVNVPFCYHLGIVYDDGKKKRIFHNSPYIKNKHGGSVCLEEYEEFMKERELLKIVRTNTHPKRILEVSHKNKKEIWDTFFFNCEDFIQEIVDGNRNSDIRDAWRIAALGILLIILID